MLKTTLESIRAEAIARLDIAAARLRTMIEAGETHTLVWEKDPEFGGLRSKVGRGYLRVFVPDSPRVNQYPGVNYCSSMGANSDDSYGGFLPGVTFDEALLLVYGDFKKNTR